MSDVLFDSLYDSEFPKARGCTQWKIKLQLFGKGGSMIVIRVMYGAVHLDTTTFVQQIL